MPRSDPHDGDAGQPRAIAWGYLAPPSFYERAVVHWRAQLEDLAAREGFIIERWFIDTYGRTASLDIMWSQLFGSGVEALFVPHPGQLHGLPRFKGRTPTEIRDQLPLQLFVLSETFAPILSAVEVNIPRQAEPPERRRRWFSRRLRREEASVARPQDGRTVSPRR